MKSILLAEDDRNFALILKRELEEDDYRVDLASDGVEAVLRFIANSYDWVLLDLRMPRLSGLDTLRIMKSLRPGVPAIAFSGSAGKAERAESVSCGAVECLAKPFEMERLMDHLRVSEAG